MNANEYRITRLYADSLGESRFEDHIIEMRKQGEIGWLSEKIPSAEMVIRTVEPGYDFDFHNAPQRQFIILIDGEIEIETSGGEVRRFNGGDILFVEDITGKGHKTKNIKKIRRRSVFITVPDSFRLGSE
ncbi:MAG: hypothetical protein EA360_03955 [Balneolaceae bacterium]|nr:MAG: hypothetical protein EA360_03955 [Balneolaceae bacterium]